MHEAYTGLYRIFWQKLDGEKNMFPKIATSKHSRISHTALGRT
jgi:hypothetical protein